MGFCTEVLDTSSVLLWCPLKRGKIIVPFKRFFMCFFTRPKEAGFYAFDRLKLTLNRI